MCGVMHFRVRESHINMERFSSKQGGGTAERMLGVEAAVGEEKVWKQCQGRIPKGCTQ